MEHRNARINDAQVIAIRIWLKHGFRQEVVAEAFGISQTTVNNVWKRNTWKHLTETDIRKCEYG